MKTHAIVLVGPGLTEDQVISARRVAEDLGLACWGERNLSPGYAHEVEVALPIDQEATLQKALSEALWAAFPAHDVAVVPLARRKKKLLCADMDSTMVIGETIEHMADKLGIMDRVAEITARAMRGEIDFRAALDERVGMLKGLTEKEVIGIADEVEYQPGAHAFIATMKAANARCVLLSGGFASICEHVRAELGFDRQVSNYLEYDDDRKLTGKVLDPLMDAQRKAMILGQEAAALPIAMGRAMAIGDGANDLPMITTAGLGIAYKAKPVVREATLYQINHTDLKTALYYQGYADDEIVERIA